MTATHPGRLVRSFNAQPFRTPRRLAVVAVGWSALALAQAALEGAVAGKWSSFGLASVYYLDHALAWAALTPAIAALMVWLREKRVHWAYRIPAHVLALLAVAILDALVRRSLSLALGGTNRIPFQATVLYFADRTIASYVMVLVVTRALEAQDRLVARATHALTLQAQLARARLAYLEEQLHPHFLFNSLGAVTELAHEAPAAAARMLRQLARLVRFALDRRGEEVALEEELEALEPYLEVQRVRFADWLKIERNVDAAATRALIPPLILQPLVENAIRHGMRGRRSAGRIEIAARVSAGRLELQVRDDGVGLGAHDAAAWLEEDGARGNGRGPRARASGGIGLNNVRERLMAIYGGASQLRLFQDPAGGTVAAVSLPFRAPNVSRALSLPEETPDAAAPVSASESAVPSRWRSPGLLVAAAWAVWGALWTQQSVAYLALRGRLGETSFGTLARADFAAAALWALATPIVFWLARAVPLSRRLLVPRLALHVSAALALASAHVGVWRLLSTYPPTESWWADATTLGWGVLVYGLLFALAQHRRVEEWLRERELATERLRADLAEARLHAITARTRPEEILTRLERMADRVMRDPEGTERELAQLGDQLRLVLDARVRVAQ